MNKDLYYRDGDSGTDLHFPARTASPEAAVQSSIKHVRKALENIYNPL